MLKKKEKYESLLNLVREEAPRANVLVAKVGMAISLVCFALYILFTLGVYQSNEFLVEVTFIGVPIMILVLATVCILRDGRGDVFKYCFIFIFTFMWVAIEMISGFKAKVLLPFLLVLTMRYYSKKFTLFTLALSIAALFTSIALGAFHYEDLGIIDLNLLTFAENQTITFHGSMMEKVIALNPDPATIIVNGLKLIMLPATLFLGGTALVIIRNMRHSLEIMLEAQGAIEREAQRKVELVDMKTKVMLSQVKPHFIYNALSSIAMYCTENPDKAQEMTLDFADYLRNNLDNISDEAESFCPFEVELGHVKKYLNIEKGRFEEKLNVQYDIRTSDFEVPTISIQTIVENAVKHGICKREDGGTVLISTRETEDGFEIIVKDDGIGFNKDAINSDGKIHIGISNIEKRLNAFGGKFTIESEEGIGTVATVFIPKEREKGE